MREITTAFFMICVLSTTMLNLAFTFAPEAMAALVHEVAEPR